MAQPLHLQKVPSHNGQAHGRAFLVFCALASMYCGVFVECFASVARFERTGIMAGLVFGTITLGGVARTLAVAAVALLALTLLAARDSVARTIERHRYALALVVLVVLVALELSGSSLSYWSSYFGQPTWDDVLFGIPRWIRSDEWCVFTPFSLSQSVSGNEAVSSLIRGGNTDVTMVYAQPAWSVATLYRPFLWGYLLLGASRGLSLFWCARAMALVLVSYELMLLVADGRRRLAAYGAVLIGFSPLVEWWFAVNGTVELLVFGQGLVLALHHVLRAPTRPRRWGWSALLAWLLGCYALIIYPAWQVPFVYVFGSLGIVDVVLWRRSLGDSGAPPRAASLLLPLGTCVALSVAGVGLGVAGAWDAIQASLNTVYPGERFFTGQGIMRIAGNPATALVSSLWPDLYTGNVCESSAFVSLMPVGVALALYHTIRGIRRGVDATLVGLLVPYGFLLAYGLVGFPPLLAKVTGLSLVFTERLPLALGYMDVALLVRALALVCEPDKGDAVRAGSAHARAARTDAARTVLGVVAALVLSAAFVLVAHHTNPQLMGVKASCLLVCGFLVLLVPVCLPGSFFAAARHGRSTWLLVSTLVVATSSLCINPLQRGTAVLTQSDLVQAVARVASHDKDATWIADTSQDGQACIVAGAPTINCVNTYPNLGLWRALDPQRTQEDVYNRYAYIEAGLAESTSFELVANDCFRVHVAPDDVSKLGVTYWLSRAPLEDWNTPRVAFVSLERVGAYTIYRIDVTQ